MQIRPRSGLALKPGFLIPTRRDRDRGYGRCDVRAVHVGDAPFVMLTGDRIAQAVCASQQSLCRGGRACRIRQQAVAIRSTGLK